MNVFDIADVLVNHVKAKYADDIAIVAYYGSYALGTANARSDLDFFFIPDTPEGYRASLQFIIDGIGFDFWPIGWERAERIATLVESLTTVIADCRLLYVRSEADLNRFMKLRENVAGMLKPDNYITLVAKAEAELQDSYVHLYKMSGADFSTDLSYTRTEAYRVATKVFQSLALLNRTYYIRGWGQNMKQIMQLPRKPKRLQQLLDILMTSQSGPEIRSSCEELAADTLALILTEKETLTGPPSYCDRMTGFYEEAKGTLNKIITACEKNDFNTAFFAAIGIQDEISRALFFAEKGIMPAEAVSPMQGLDVYRQLELPDLVALLDPNNLTPLREAVQRLDQAMQHLLAAKGVEIKRFDTVADFAAFVRSLKNEVGRNG
jgi:hypothetical protein